MVLSIWFRLLAFAPFAFVAIQCTPLTIEIQKAEVNSHPSGKLLAGAGKTDITPIPGFPMAGDGLFASTVARGWWTRLFARAVYLEDPSGQPLVLVSCDLWAMPSGLANEVVHLVQKQFPFIGRENFIIAAIHSHHAPGGTTTSEFYTICSADFPGFDKALFEFLAQRIANAIVTAIQNKRPAKLLRSSTKISGLCRNRSMPAFRRNREWQAIVEENRDLSIGLPSPLYPDTNAFRAVDPALNVVNVRDSVSDKSIAVMAFLSLHPNTVSHSVDLYNGGIFGVASALEEEFLNCNGDSQTIVPLFNGAEGDISAVWTTLDRATTERMGLLIAKAIDSLISCPALQMPTSTFICRLNYFPISGVRFPSLGNRVDCLDSDTLETAKRGIPGNPTLGGAEEYRSALFGLGFAEGDTSKVCDTDDHQGKKVRASVNVPGLHQLGEVITSWASSQMPKEVPVGLYCFGDFTIVAIPGEATTTLGRRLCARVRRELPEVGQAVVVGLANEYLSYFATPEEYAAQDYEGSSTLYGPATGPFFENAVITLSKQKPSQGIFGGFKYHPGPSESFGFNWIKTSNRNGSATLAPVASDDLSQLDGKCPQDVIDVQFVWYENAADLSPNPDERVLPSVSIQEQASGEISSWMTAATPINGRLVRLNDNAIDLVVTARCSKDCSQIQWRVTWSVFDRVPLNTQYRFAVRTVSGRELCSQAFTIGTLLSGRLSPVLSPYPPSTGFVGQQPEEIRR